MASPHDCLPRRRRAKKACETCKVRKRKCDGREPCGFCLRYEFHCSYAGNTDDSHRARRTASPSTSATAYKSDAAAAAPPNKSFSQRGSNNKAMEANSGMVFAHLLGLNLNPSGDGPKVHGFGWNLGLANDEPVSQHTDIVSLLSGSDMDRLADIYMERIQPIYGFLDPAGLRLRIVERWRPKPTGPATADRYDAVLCGVGALASLFSRTRDPRLESALVRCAKDMLEGPSTMTRPRFSDAEAWLLRTMYLRSTSPPHAAWMASCATMHIMEAVGAHQDPTAVSVVYLDTADTSPADQESQRRLFWVASILNTWISSEYGRSRVVLRGVSCKPPQPRRDDFTADLVKLNSVFEQMEADTSGDDTDLAECLARLERLDIRHDALVLSQSNMSLTIYRRMRLVSPSPLVAADTLNRVIRLARTGVEAAVRLAEAGCPWWHVANLPFQFVCVLLAIDTERSLTSVGYALRCLRTVAGRFQTRTIRVALETAECLVRLSQRKKERDLSLLRDGLDQPGGAGAGGGAGCGSGGGGGDGGAGGGGGDYVMQLSNGSGSDEIGATASTGTVSALLDNTVPDWDWNTFLSTEIPVFGDLHTLLPGDGRDR